MGSLLTSLCSLQMEWVPRPFKRNNNCSFFPFKNVAISTIKPPLKRILSGFKRGLIALCTFDYPYLKPALKCLFDRYFRGWQYGFLCYYYNINRETKESRMLELMKRIVAFGVGWIAGWIAFFFTLAIIAGVIL